MPAKATRSDSPAANKNHIRCPDSRQMMSGTVQTMTAAQAIIRAAESGALGVAGFIACRADIAALLRDAVERLAQFFELGNLAGEGSERFERGRYVIEKSLVAFDQPEKTVGSERLHETLNSAEAENGP